VTKWEYHICRFGALAPWDTIQIELSSLGREGWELIAIQDGRNYIFKRPAIQP
jgi:hypothetical protein